MGVTKEQRDQAAAEREWARVLADHAATVLRSTVRQYSLDNIGAPIEVAPDQGGLAVSIQGPDGQWRRYFVRLTEVRA